MKKQAGFTVIEMLMALVVLAILATLAAPSFTDQLARRRLEGVATDLSTDLQFARTQAVSDRNSVQVVIDNGGTRYRVINSANVTLKTVDLPSEITATSPLTVTYDQLRGMANAVQVTLQSTRTVAQVRVDTSAMGRVSMCTPAGNELRGYTTC